MTVQSKLDLCIMGNKEVQVGGGGGRYTRSEQYRFNPLNGSLY